MKLYDIPNEFASLWEQIEAAESDEQINSLESIFSEMLQESTNKVEAAAKVVKMLEADATAAADEIKRLTAKKQSAEKQSDRLKGLMLYAVDTAFSGKVKTPLFTIYGQSSAPTLKFEPAPDADITTLPAEFVRISADLNRKSLADAFKEGREIPDAIIVSEEAGKRTLRIR